MLFKALSGGPDVPLHAAYHARKAPNGSASSAGGFSTRLTGSAMACILRVPDQ